MKTFYLNHLTCWRNQSFEPLQVTVLCSVLSPGSSVCAQCGNWGERPWRRRLHRAERLRWDQRQPDGAADHDQRLQDCVLVPRHCGHTLLPLRQAGQERQGSKSALLAYQNVVLDALHQRRNIKEQRLIWMNTKVLVVNSNTAGWHFNSHLRHVLMRNSTWVLA